jgi:hypothetical protein
VASGGSLGRGQFGGGAAGGPTAKPGMLLRRDMLCAKWVSPWVDGIRWRGVGTGIDAGVDCGIGNSDKSGFLDDSTGGTPGTCVSPFIEIPSPGRPTRLRGRDGGGLISEGAPARGTREKLGAG